MNKKVIACFMSIVVMIFYIGFGNMNVIAEEVSSCGSGYQEILNYANGNLYFRYVKYQYGRTLLYL